MAWWAAIGLCLICLFSLPRLMGPSWLGSFQTWFLLVYFAMDFLGAHFLIFEDARSVPQLVLPLLYFLPLCHLAAIALFGRLQPVSAYGACSGSRGGPASSSMAIAVVVAVAGVLLLFYLVRVPMVPLFVAVDGPDRVEVARSLSSSWMEGSLFKRVWVAMVRHGVPLLSLITLCRLRFIPTPRNRVLFLLLACMGVFLTLLEGQKAQIVFYGVQMLIADRLARRHERSAARKRSLLSQLLKALLVVFVGFEVVAYAYYSFNSTMQGGGLGFLEAQHALASAIFRRITITQAEPLLAVFKIFPDHLDFLHGKTLPIAALMGVGPRFDLSRYTCEFLRPGSDCVASTLYVSEVYANFGWSLAFLAIFIFAFGMAAVDRTLHSALNTPEKIGAYAFLAGHVMRLPITQAIMGLGIPVMAVVIFFLFSSAAGALLRLRFGELAHE